MCLICLVFIVIIDILVVFIQRIHLIMYKLYLFMLTNVKKWQQIRVASERLSTSIQCIYYISICVENKICFFFVFFNSMTGSNISDLSVPPHAYVSTSTYLSILQIHVFIHMQDSFYLDSNICIATRHPTGTFSKDVFSQGAVK